MKILKNINKGIEKAKNALISELESDRTHEIQVIALTYKDYTERLNWLKKEYGKYITYYEYQTGIKEAPKTEIYKLSTDKKGKPTKTKIQPDQNKENVFDTLTDTDNKEISTYQIAYYEYIRTKDLIFIDNLIKKTKGHTEISDPQRHLLKIKFNSEVPKKLEYFTKNMFFQIIDLKIKELEINNKAPETSQLNKLKWTGSQNELITMFFDLQRYNLIKGNTETINKLIHTYFVDKENKPFSESYIRKILTPSKEKSKNRLDFSPLL